MNPEAIARLLALRERLFKAIGAALAEDGHCKRYEGGFTIGLPNYFEQDEEQWTVGLDCYVIGPSRHYTWTAPSLMEAVAKADRDVLFWISEWAEDRPADLQGGPPENPQPSPRGDHHE